MLNEKLDKYLKNDYYPFHMPGSKRTDILRNDLPYQRDLTEIDGFDNLNNPKEILLDLNKKISDIYGVKNAIISTNGSTSGILATIRALTYKNKNILIQRSSHKAVYNAIELNQLEPSYIDVVVNKENAVVDIDYNDLFNKLSSKNFAAVVVTSPSYEGYFLDLERIHNECKKLDIPLIVDLAHGSHLILNDLWSDSFDIAITSFHKNLSALTPSACVLINNENYTEEIKRNMAIFQSSSPSYITMQSIDDMVENFPNFSNLFLKLEKELNEMYSLKLNHLKLIDHPKKDRSKILISTIDTNINGNRLQEFLKEEKIEIEMTSPSYALLIASIFDKKYGFDRLKKSLLKIDDKIYASNKKMDFSYKIPSKELNPAEAILKDKKYINLNKANNKIAGQFVYAYPPGIPLIVPGEIIDSTVLNNIKNLIANGIDINVGDDILIID